MAKPAPVGIRWGVPLSSLLRVAGLLAAAAAVVSAPALRTVAAEPPSGDAVSAPDPFTAQREALFDAAFKALVAGDLDGAERAFTAAAALGGEPAARAVAASFAARVQALRAARVAATLSSAPPAAAPDNAGHIPFLLTTTALGLGLFGWTLPGILAVHSGESPRTFVGLYMLAGAAGFVVPFLLTHGEPVSAGQANLAFYGGTRGALLGFLTASLITGDASPTRRYRAFSGSLLAGSVLGLGGGMALANRAQMSPGQAHTQGVLGDFGMAFGLGSAFLLSFDEGDLTTEQKARRISAAVLLGGAGGLLGGYRLGRARDNTWGDAEILRAAGLCGVLAGITAADGLELGRRGTAATIMAGGVLGAVAGDRLVAGTDFSVGQSILVDLSGIAGGLAAAGLLYLVSPRDWSERPYLLAATLGAGTGLGVSYRALRDRGPAGGTARNGDGAAPSVALLPLFGPGLRGATLATAF